MAGHRGGSVRGLLDLSKQSGRRFDNLSDIRRRGGAGYAVSHEARRLLAHAPMRKTSRLGIDQAGRWTALLAGALVATSCIVQKPLELPVSSDTGWAEIKSKHFRLV